MNADVEFHIRHNYAWNKLPANVKQSLGNSQREFEKTVVLFSIKNQLRYKGNLVKTVYKRDERQYYEALLQYSREHLMLYPYHLSDVMVKGLRITPFAYYLGIMQDIMSQEKSYDSLPNFTAADCLRLLGIGRNQYIDLMNQCRSSKKFFRKKSVKELLPVQPIEEVAIDCWWMVHIGYITEDDVRACTPPEKAVIDKIIDAKNSILGKDLKYTVLHSLYRKGLVYLEVPIADEDYIIVPPLEGFVMNRVLGDYFETLLYKIFVSIDEHTTVAELANVLEINLDLVKNAVSMYCRLGFAKKKNVDLEDQHPSWKNITNNSGNKKPTPDQLLIDWTSVINEQSDMQDTLTTNTAPDSLSLDWEKGSEPSCFLNFAHSKRIAFIFDSTLTAFLMMGNLSPGLKSHAVTMFEVGKLSDESLDSFLTELEKVNPDAEGEAQRYFDHALTLRDTIRFLRYNRELHLGDSGDNNSQGMGIDLLRCESLLGLDHATCARILNKNYALLISMAPLSNEVRPITSCTPQHLGPAVPEVNSVWFKLFIYHMTSCGPPTLLLVKGSRLRRLPRVFKNYDKLLVTTWGHDPGVIATSNILVTLNEALTHSAVMVQGHGWHQHEGEVHHVTFPFVDETDGKDCADDFSKHKAIQHLSTVVDLIHNCGYISLLKTGKSYTYTPEVTACSTQQTKQSIGQNLDQSAASDTKVSHANQNPSNGINNAECAEVLQSELDSLGRIDERQIPGNVRLGSTKESVASSQVQGSNNSSTSESGVSKHQADRTKLKLDLKDGVKHAESSCEESMESQWLLLDCYFGIPLFGSDINIRVCDKILKKGLCNKNSLKELLHSSRTLSLRLLSFIAENQDLPAIQEHNNESGMIPSAGLHVEQTVPLPTHNLLFNDGHLSPWNGL